MAVKISGTEKGSPAQRYGLKGCTLLSIDGHEINDMLDYEFYSSGEALELAVMKDGALCYLSVQKKEYEPLGCNFDSYLIDQKHSCKNKCVFCFIDQMPKGLRETLYFKDDDERLSFLFGNYVTLTNLSEREVERIKTMHISPINISVHTVNPELRVAMMKNKHAGDVLRYIDEFAKAYIQMNCQLVLCRGINDGDELKKSLEKLTALYPAVQSIAAVPSGLTKYREGLYPLEPYDKQTAIEVLGILEEYGEQCYKRHGVRIVYPSDEWYLLAEREIPPREFYDSFCQLENGVGMWRMLHDEFMEALEETRAPLLPKKIDLATGELAYPLICRLANAMQGKMRNVKIEVHEIKNEFFGGNVTVAGLITGTDLIKQLKGKLSSRTLGIPEVMLREERDKFLDDVTVKELERELGVRVRIMPQRGDDLVQALLK